MPAADLDAARLRAGNARRDVALAVAVRRVALTPIRRQDGDAERVGAADRGAAVG